MYHTMDTIEMNSLYINNIDNNDNNDNNNNDNDDDNDNNNIVFIDTILLDNHIDQIDQIDIERKDSISECPICFLELHDNNIKMPCCKKDVHLHCIYKCLTIKNTCPFCRNPYNSETTPHNTIIFNYNNCIIQCDNPNSIIPIENKQISNKYVAIILCLLLIFVGIYITIFIYPILIQKNE